MTRDPRADADTDNGSRERRNDQRRQRAAIEQHGVRELAHEVAEVAARNVSVDEKRVGEIRLEARVHDEDDDDERRRRRRAENHGPPQAAKEPEVEGDERQADNEVGLGEKRRSTEHAGQRQRRDGEVTPPRDHQAQKEQQKTNAVGARGHCEVMREVGEHQQRASGGQCARHVIEAQCAIQHGPAHAYERDGHQPVHL